MSAVLTSFEAPIRPAAGQQRAQLRAVDRIPSKLSTIPFVVLLVTLMGAGMVGLLVLNVQIQERSQRIAALQQQAQRKGFQEAALTSQVHQLRSSVSLQQKAWQLGLRPNPHPVFLVLPSGTIVGEPVRVSGGEYADQQFRTADQVAADVKKANEAAIARKKAAAAAAKKAQADRIAAQKAAAAAKAKADAAKAAAAKPGTAKPAATPASKAPASKTPASKTKPSTAGGR